MVAPNNSFKPNPQRGGLTQALAAQLRNRMFKHLALVLLLSAPSVAFAAPEIDCNGSPKDAALELPAPLSDWGRVVCTPYGHVIASQTGWIWTYPGAMAPVFVPSQMIRSSPKELGNSSYFSRVSFDQMPLGDDLTAKALTALDSGYKASKPSHAYKLTAKSSLGTTLSMYFFQTGDSIWGIWCDDAGKECNSDTGFMVLDAREGS